MAKILNVLSKLVMILNIIKKVIALFSTAFMTDCKLFGDGHFGIECIDQVRVISVDNSFNNRPFITQNGIEISIDKLNEKDECLLPLCSCIHPSTLRWNSIKYPELYERCFTDQCNNFDNICFNKPNGSKCQMRNRMCMDIHDWCGKQPWFSELPPAIVTNSDIVMMPFENEYHQIYTGGAQVSKYDFEIDCDNGRVCCRFLLGSDINQEYYDKNDMEWMLKTFCGALHVATSGLVENNKDNPFEMASIIFKTKYFAPAYINKESIWTVRSALFDKARSVLGDELVYDKCVEYGVLPGCSYAISKTKFMKDVTSYFLNYYQDNKLCINVLFTSK